MSNIGETTQYIGARYVPMFGRKDESSIEWDNSKPYEPMTIVLHQGNSYTSRQYVPAGIPLTNLAFWALTGDYNSQIEQYRAEVQQYDERIKSNATGVQEAKSAFATETTARESADDALGSRIDDAEDALAATIDETMTALAEEKQTRQTADDNLTTTINTEKTAREGAISAESQARQTADSNLQTAINGKAPTSHASAEGTYGLGSSTTYGHVKTSDVVSNETMGAVAITPKGAYATAQQLVQAGVQPIHDYVDGKFPVTKLNMAPLSVGSEQLDGTAINAILSQLTVRWFDSTNPAADNAGLIAETGTRIKGFYIPAIKMLVIQDCDADAVDREKNIAWTLPNYIPKVVSEQGVKFGGLVYNSDNAFVSWGRLVLNTKGVIYTDTLSAYSGGGTSFSSGTCVYFLHDAVGAQLASSGYEAAKADSGVI